MDMLAFSGKSGEVVQVARQAVEAFRIRLRGASITGTDDGYDEVRVVWNGMIDKRPALSVPQPICSKKNRRGCIATW